MIAVTWVGASANWKLFKMHFHLTFNDDINPDVDVTYCTRNLHSLQEKRFICFIKTTGNCLYNSGCGKYTCYMWKGEMFILWDHIADVFFEYCECGVHLLPKITYQTHEINICSSFKFYMQSVMFC